MTNQDGRTLPVDIGEEDGRPGESDWWWMPSDRTEVILLSAWCDVGMSASVLAGHRRKK
jgi:hypothetical protein